MSFRWSFLDRLYVFLALLKGYLLSLIRRPLGSLERRLQDGLIQVFKAGPVPEHVAFIMDGNRRFAKKKGLSRTSLGHAAGFEGLQKTMEWCYDLGVKALTVYAFSIENFNRSPEEVSTLMSLALEKFNYMVEKSEILAKYDIQIRVLGELDLLPEDVRMAAEWSMQMTKGNKGPVVNICFPYTAKAELITVSNKILSDLRSGALNNDALTVGRFTEELYTAGCPPVDILVRTSGERRLSEFLNWQAANHRCQIEFLDLLWPDFRFHHFIPILAKFQLNRLTESL